MRLVFVINKIVCLAAALAVLPPAWAQTTATPHSNAKPMGHVPTRMQRCESEVASLKGADRKRVLRECLVNRNEGERIVSRNCSRQFRDLPPSDTKDTKIDRGVFMKQCVQTSLKAGHDKLPDRKPAAAASAPVAAAAKSEAAKPAVPAVAKPATAAAAKPVASKP